MEVLYNILDNSYEAILQMKSLLTEEGQKEYYPRIVLDLSEDNSNYYIKITDNGAGMKKEDEEKMFTPFFTTKSSENDSFSDISGTGIGVYIIKRLICDNHGGKVKFETEHLKGSSFTIELPKRSDSSIKKDTKFFKE